MHPENLLTERTLLQKIAVPRALIGAMCVHFAVGGIFLYGKLNGPVSIHFGVKDSETLVI